MKLTCKCGKTNIVKETYPEYLNWKCKECNAINAFNGNVGVVWKCDPGTAGKERWKNNTEL